jgi:hypothetical protein
MSPKMKRRDFVLSSIGVGAWFGAGPTRAFAQPAAQAPTPPPAKPPADDPIQSLSRAAGPVADPWPGTKKLLFVADVQAGYHHDAINHTMGVVEELGRKSGAFVTFLRTDSQLITKRPIAPQGKYAPARTSMSRRWITSTPSSCCPPATAR